MNRRSRMVELGLAVLVIFSALVISAATAFGSGDAAEMWEGGAQTGDSDAAVAAAEADLAARLGVDPSSITMVSADAVDWPDSSLGCPEPGRAYSQIVTPGYRVVLDVNGTTYEYHASRAGDPLYCEAPRPPLGG